MLRTLIYNSSFQLLKMRKVCIGTGLIMVTTKTVEHRETCDVKSYDKGRNVLILLHGEKILLSDFFEYNIP